MTVVVRRVEVGDVDAYRRVRLAALRESPSAFGSTYERESQLSDEEWAERVRLSSAGDDRATFLAFDDDEVVGLAGCYFHEGRPELISMWTDPRVRRAGAGRALVDAVLAFARAAGATQIGLWVTTGNDAAQRLYESFGFEVTGDVQPLPSDPCKDETRMRLAL